MKVRTAHEHWPHLSLMLDTLERCVEHCARLDVYRPSRQWEDAAVQLDARIVGLQDRIDHEIDILTAERLTVELERKRRRHAAA